MAFAGGADVYDASGISGYNVGIKYNDVLYAGQSNNVSLNLGATNGYVVPGNFSASAGTLSGSSNPYTLTMPNSNVIITATIGFPLDITAGGWQAISSPMHNSGNDETAGGVTHLTDADYDLFYYDEDDATWRNYKHSAFDLVRGTGYIYRRSTATTLIFTGQPNTGNVSVNLTSGGPGDLKGFNLIGNPYPADLPFNRAYYSLNADGTWQAHTEGGTLAPAQAVLVYASSDEALTLSPEGIVTGGGKGYLPPVPKGLTLSDPSEDADDGQNGSNGLNGNFAHWDGNQIVVDGTQAGVPSALPTPLPAELQVYDVMGRMVSSTVVAGKGACVPAPGHPGVYVLRLGGRSQKIVIM